ncbi:MAG: hypothetical protein WAN24_10825, partial [Candidatus Acidiferrales bacterium]
MNRKPILVAITLLGLLVLAGCGSGGSAGIVVQLTNVPATLTVNQSVSLTATVSNDSSTGNLNWSCTPSGSCGTFSPATTANGGATSYTAPNAPGSVTIVATDADHTGSTASATISVVAVGSNGELTGNYVFFAEGTDSNGLYVVTGTIVTDGNGNITSGEQDYADPVTDAGPDSITGNYSIAASGQASLTLNVNDITLPNNGVETFSAALTSATHGFVIEFDGAATSSGTLDFQPTATPITAASIVGSYAFAVNGIDSSESPAALGGVVSINASTGLVPSGTVYVNDSGSPETVSISGSVTGPDSFGRGTISLSGLAYTYYAVQGEVLRTVEADADFLAGGAFYGQGTAGANSSFSNSSLSGPYAFYESGSSVNGSLALGGQFTAASGTLSAGFADTNDGGTYEKGSIANSPYSIPGNGSGTLTLPGTPSTTEDVSALLIFATDPALNLLDPNNTSGGGGALILDNDANAVGTGLIVPQVTGAFQGNYAVNLQFFPSAGGEEDFVGQTTQSGGSFMGTVDLNDNGVTASGTSFAGTSTADTTNVGRYTGKFTVGANSYNITYYQVNSGELLIIDTDSNVGNGFMES